MTHRRTLRRHTWVCSNVRRGFLAWSVYTRTPSSLLEMMVIVRSVYRDCANGLKARDENDSSCIVNLTEKKLVLIIAATPEGNVPHDHAAVDVASILVFIITDNIQRASTRTRRSLEYPSP